MSTFDADDLQATGYFLPEDTQRRLKKLREYVAFLAKFARPRAPEQGQAWTAEIRVGEVATCLELLQGQIGQLLDELSRPAGRGERAGACETDARADADDDAVAAAPDTAEPVMDAADNRCLFGVTLDQLDEINLLLDSVRAHGTVVTTSDHAELNGFTLSIMGDAIVRDAQKLRDIIRDVDAQQLGPTQGARTGVREERAVYHVLPARLPMDRASHAARHLPTYQ